ncbi:MAG TPA: trehalase family glycosidase [Patescibacteria group bacterium]|nr:trehalase family glycosidase [Patescibacteria group bacterium]
MTNDFKKTIKSLMLSNRRHRGGNLYTLPSPESYPYQWLWDSCFHAIILSHYDISSAKEELLSLFVRQFENGMIPHMIYWQKKTASDFPVIEWGKEDTSSITQPPMLAYSVWQIYQKDKNKKFLDQIYPNLTKFYRYFLEYRDFRGNNLISIINPDESGEDNSSRFDVVLGLPPKHSLKENFKKRLELIQRNRECKFNARTCMKNFFWVKDVPFNSILVENLKCLSDIASVLGKHEDADLFFDQSKLIAAAMRKHMFEDGVFWSLHSKMDIVGEKISYKKIKVKTWAIFAPLFAMLYTKSEANKIIEKYLQNEEEFNAPFLIPTVSLSEESFNPDGFWRGPVWMSTNWFIYKGLQKYGYETLAEKIKQSSLDLLEKSGFREQYNPLTGEGYGAKKFTWGGLVIDM